MSSCGDGCAGLGSVERVGVEGTSSYGAGLSRHLAAHDVKVIEVLRPRRRARRGHKCDPADAEPAARAVLSGEAPACPLDDDICEQRVRRDVTRFRRLKVVFWVLLGLLPLGFVPLMRRLLRWSFYPDETAALLGQVAAVYFVVFTYALIAASVWLVVDAFRAKVWRSREGQTPEQWRGGTQECLVMGRLCRNGPILGRRDLAAFSQYG